MQDAIPTEPLELIKQLLAMGVFRGDRQVLSEVCREMARPDAVAYLSRLDDSQFNEIR